MAGQIHSIDVISQLRIPIQTPRMSFDRYKPSELRSSSSQLVSAKLNPENVVEDEEATWLTWDWLQQESPRERQGVGKVIVHLNSSY
jgi:hypothetical protein